MYNKNEKIEFDIIDMTKEGLGVAKVDSQVFFVKDALVGDRVSAIITKAMQNNNGKKLIFAKKLNVIKESEYRAKEKCKVSDACGGCQVMGLSYDKQLLLKENFVKNDLMHIGGFNKEFIEEKYEGIVGMDKPYYFRNKMQIPFAVHDGKVISGFYAGRTHHIVENEGCKVSFEAAYRIIDEVKKYLSEKDTITIYNEKSGYGVFRELMLRQGNKTHEISVTFIVNDKKKDKEKYMPLVERLIKINSNIKTITLNINTNNNNVLFGNENIVLYGNGYIEDEILGLKFHISPESFYQVNNVQTEKLYMTALDFIDECKEGVSEALDLYCGIGTITLNLSKKVKHITGIEIVNEAVNNAKINAGINNIENADFICMDAANVNNSEYLLNKKYDLISVDPPRKGLDTKTIDFIKVKSPRYLLYISCDPATLSRDISLLNDVYEVKKVKCVDMFPHTMHVETVVLMSRVDK